MIKLCFLLLLLINILKLNNGQSTIDPWYFEQRNSLYQEILNSTVIPSIFGDGDEGNCLHGLPLQLHWQAQSGRLNLTQDSTGEQRIDEFSWWADMNYFLSVVPYIAAMEVGLVPQITIKPPLYINASLFCLNFQDCDSEVTSHWFNYFSLIKEIQNNPLPSSYTDQDILQVMWIAHTTSIKYAKVTFSAELDLFNEKEKKFGFGWGNFVEVLATVNFNTNYTDVSSMEVALPPRVLKVSDVPPFIKDMTKDQNNIVASMFAVADLAESSTVWNLFMGTLDSIVKNPKCQYYINAEISAYIQRPVKTIIDILEEAIIKCKNI